MGVVVDNLVEDWILLISDLCLAKSGSRPGAIRGGCFNALSLVEILCLIKVSYGRCWAGADYWEPR